MTVFKQDKITIYTVGAFGADKVEAKLNEMYVKDYAQYTDRLALNYRIKRKRKDTLHTFTRDPFMVVLKGWNQVDPCSGFDVEDQGATVVNSSKYGCFDDRYKSEFIEFIEKHVEDNNIEPLLYFKDAEGMSEVVKGLLKYEKKQ